MKNYRIGVYLLTAIMLLCACAEMSAQTFAKIKVQQDGLIKLPAESQIQETYLLDISDLRFTSEEEAISYLSDKSSPYYYLRSRGNTSEAVMVVRIGEHPNLTKTQWIEYIKKASAEKPLKK